METTIAAIATAMGVGAINIIKVSGKDAISIVNKVFKGPDLIKSPTHTIHYGHIIDNEEIIDEVLVSIFKAPKTYTKEDVIEINCHGGIAPTNKILELLLLNGAVIAEPGEFTKRAFLNGRIDLIEAEGIIDLISSKTEEARKMAISQVDGNVSNLIKDLRNYIVKILANIEVNIDYPEYEDILDMTINELKPLLEEMKIKISEILEESKNAIIFKEGIKTVIIGKPNVGKSSLLNLLLGFDKAIVTDVAGTTRDIVEGTINVAGILLNIIDTAGIRKTEDIVEKIGVEKSINLIAEADLIILVLANDEIISKEEEEILEKIKTKNHIVVVNKSDLQTKINISADLNAIKLSTLEKSGIKDLKNRVKEMFNLEKIKSKDMTYLTSSRAIAILKEILIIINNIEESLEIDLPIDIIEIDIKKIWDLLGQIIGTTYQDELIDQLFSQFCLGK